MTMTRRQVIRMTALGVTLAASTPLTAMAAPTRKMDVYKSPYCGCCSDWITHMEAAGFNTRAIDVDDLDPIKERYGVHPYLQSCHTAVVGGYIIEGHVPAREVIRLLDMQPKALGLAVPGMPIGSPGMEQGNHREPFDVILFTAKSGRVFARY